MSKQDEKKLYEQQEEKILAQSDAFISLLTKRGILADQKIDSEKVRSAKQEKTKNSYHNTLMLSRNQREGMEGQAFIPDFIVYIRTDDQTYSYILSNTTTSSFIRVEKHDAETGKIIPAAGVGFQVRDLSTGDLIAETIYYPTPVTIDTFFTYEEGWLMLPSVDCLWQTAFHVYRGAVPGNGPDDKRRTCAHCGQ